MGFREMYEKKKVTMDDVLNMIKDNDRIGLALAGCEPAGVLERLHEIDSRVKNVEIYNSLEFSTFPFQTPEVDVKNIKTASFFFGKNSRKLQPIRRSSLLPCHLRNFAKITETDKRPTVFMASVTPMDKHGFFNMSLSLVYELEFLEKADVVILEVNDQMPLVYGDTMVHISQVDYIYEYSHKIVSAQSVQPSEKEKKVGEYIADLVNDGDTFQLGIGGIPNAVAASMMHKKDLGIHTEMFTEGMMDLMKAGAVTNRKKNFLKGKAVATFAFGSQDLYDFLDCNMGVTMMDGTYVNDPNVIAQNDNMISINTTLQVDLTGQCCSESIGNRQYSGIGGQTDTVLGALWSKGGRSVIALLSTTRDEKISKITPFLTEGAAVTLSRYDVDYIVTEYGVAPMKNRTVAERAANLIQIAHPKFRKELEETAEKYQIW